MVRDPVDAARDLIEAICQFEEGQSQCESLAPIWELKGMSVAQLASLFATAMQHPDRPVDTGRYELRRLQFLWGQLGLWLSQWQYVKRPWFIANEEGGSGLQEGLSWEVAVVGVGQGRRADFYHQGFIWVSRPTKRLALDWDHVYELVDVNQVANLRPFIDYKFSGLGPTAALRGSFITPLRIYRKVEL